MALLDNISGALSAGVRAAISNGNVLLIDPNTININNNVVNGIPQYQDMFFIAELIATRKGRTLLEIQGSKVSFGSTGLENSITVNFLGSNQDSSDSNPNFNKFTTNWYDGSSGDRVQYEGFGISNIKISINSSFVPQVNVQFIDLRGLAFFNQENSPYRTLFDFPPPIFTLTLKGYYGLKLEYKLHLVKYTSEFKSENGNFIIDAQFVALTYAPLTDVLFRYAINFPLIGNEINANPSTNTIPSNTNELILKVKNLMTAIDENKNSSPVVKSYENTVVQVDNFNELFAILNNYDNDETLKSIQNPLLLIHDTEYHENGIDELTEILKPFEYDSYVKQFSTTGIPVNTATNSSAVIGANLGAIANSSAGANGVNINNSSTVSQRLIIAYLIGSKINKKDAIDLSNQSNQNQAGAQLGIAAKLTYALEILNAYAKNILINKAINLLGFNIVQDNDIPKSTTLIIVPNASTEPDLVDLYAYIDITDYYMKLYKEKTNSDKKKNDEMTAINTEINDIITQNLGMKPTIYNIFKIILDDVDTFFRILRKTAFDAENHHNNELFINQIVNDGTYADTKRQHIFAFPLVVKREVICNQTKESRTIPKDISDKLSKPFPEITLIQNFIETFYKQKEITEILNMRAEQNEDGTYKWIPISPVDSKMLSSTLESPYFGVDSTGGGGINSQPINISEDSRLVNIFKILLTRFYVLSQSSYADTFYNTDEGSEGLVKMYSQSESVNLSSSMTNQDYINLMSNAATTYGNLQGIQSFYDYIKTNMSDFYSFEPENKKYFKLSNNGIEIYLDKGIANKTTGKAAYVTNYQGFDIYAGSVSIRNGNAESNNPVDTFQKDIENGWWARNFNIGESTQGYYEFTEQNVVYIKDVNNSNSNTSTTTRFMSNLKILDLDTFGDDEIVYVNKISLLSNPVTTGLGFIISVIGANKSKINKNEFIDNAIINGNAYFNKIGAQPYTDAQKIDLFGDIVEIWSNQLYEHDNDIFKSIIQVTGSTFNSRLSALILLSSFGYALSPFNIYPGELNKYIFNNPAAIEVPYFLPAYIGALVDLSQQQIDDIKNFFTVEGGKNLRSSGSFIFADIYDVNHYLSAEDKKKFKLEFDAFYGNGSSNSTFYGLVSSLMSLYFGANVKGVDKEEYYNNALNPSSGTYYNTILGVLMNRTTLINFSQLTFNTTYENIIGYTSLDDLLVNADKKTIIDNYFIGLFQKLVADLITKKTEITKKNKELQKLTNDIDILTQGYYSFKNINDKWLTNPAKIEDGYPFNDNNTGSLIDSFAFVDRAMNPIGNTIINPEPLIQLMDDPNVSVYSVISQLLSANGFEFFPIQNFMAYDNKSWEASFKIDAEGILTSRPAFVCMYIGGSSSYPSNININNQFEDDGILDISSSNLPDFSASDDCHPIPFDDGQIDGSQMITPNKSPNNGNKTFPYRQVRAFRVRFGEQNQSMFSNIKIDSKEYPETNESIQILSRIAGDNKLNAPPPKGQNLYNVYENRAYKATITGLGNAMIQPTQYFQIENIPMFNGAYLIIGVEHNIEPNKMTTSFSGTKILKYPMPRVLEPAAVFGFEGGNTDKTNPAMSGNYSSYDANGNPNAAKFNSMHDFKIQ